MQREQWHLTEGLIFAHFAVFILGSMMEGGRQALALIPGYVIARPWTLVTYQFVHGTGMFWFFISMLVLWIMARPLEESWGSPRFLVFWLVATFGASLTAVAVGRLLYGDIGFGTCLLFTFATLYPEVEFRLFFIIPVKVKYLAIVAAAILVYSSLSYGLVAGLANVAGTSAGYLFFLATRRMPTRRKLIFQLNKRKAEISLRAENEQAQDRNRGWDAAVRAADARARETGAIGEEDETLLVELDAAAILVYSSLSYGLVAGLANVAGTSAGYLFFLATRRMPTRRKLMFQLNKRKADVSLRAENEQAEDRNRGWDAAVRAADARAGETGAIGEEDETLLAELDAARDPSITVCAPSEFAFIDDDVCRRCTGYAECAARRIRMSAEERER